MRNQSYDCDMSSIVHNSALSSSPVGPHQHHFVNALRLSSALTIGCTIVHFGERTIESLVRRICHCNRVLSAGKVYNRSSVVMIQNVFDDKVHDGEIFSKYFTRKLHNRFQWIG